MISIDKILSRSFFIFLLVMQCSLFSLAENSFKSLEADKENYILTKIYSGSYKTIQSDGYTRVSSIGKLSSTTVAQSFCKALTEKFDCVFVLSRVIGKNENGHPNHLPGQMMHLSLPKGYRYFDSQDTNCQSSSYLGDEVLAVGKWTWRTKPRVGGYAHSIKKAWRLNYENLQFIEIKVANISCVINDDRN